MHSIGTARRAIYFLYKLPMPKGEPRVVHSSSEIRLIEMHELLW